MLKEGQGPPRHSADDASATLRERNKAERRTRIVDGAVELLSEGGLDALTMRALSERASVSVPTIYNLIGDRDHILLAVVDRSGAIFDAEIATLTADPIDRCFDLGRRVAARMTAHPRLTRSIIAEGLAPMLAAAETPILHRYARALYAAIREGTDQGHIQPITSIELMVRHLASVVAVTFYRWATDADADPGGEYVLAGVIHATGMTLATATSGVSRDRVFDQLERATDTLANRPPSPPIPTIDRFPSPNDLPSEDDLPKGTS